MLDGIASFFLEIIWSFLYDFLFDKIIRPVCYKTGHFLRSVFQTAPKRKRLDAYIGLFFWVAVFWVVVITAIILTP